MVSPPHQPGKTRQKGNLGIAENNVAKRNAIVRHLAAVETLGSANVIASDKTGTLTYGKPILQEIVVLADVAEQDCLVIAASLELASEHPLAESFLNKVQRTELLGARQAQNIPGKGVSGFINETYSSLGNRKLTPLTENLPVLANMQPGATLVWLCDERRPLAMFVLSDGLRPQAAEMVSDLKRQGIKVTILSGDAEEAVAHIAAQAGIENWRAGMRPEDKLAALRSFQKQGDIVAMAGDGVNDAPVLAGADVSLAMGGGTQVARSSSDIVLLSESLPDIRRSLETGKASMMVMRQNFIWAIVYNLLALPFAAAGLIPPWLASLGMSASSLVVVLNALRLR